MKFDQHDDRKSSIVRLVDNCPFDRQKYYVSLETGFRKGAGTTAQVGRHLSSVLLLLRYRCYTEVTVTRRLKWLTLTSVTQISDTWASRWWRHEGHLPQFLQEKVPFQLSMSDIFDREDTFLMPANMAW